MKLILRDLNSGDSFTFITFSDAVTHLVSDEFSPENLNTATEIIEKIDIEGGTDLNSGLQVNFCF